jgi:lipopolysaccharide transport system permease protein
MIILPLVFLVFMKFPGWALVAFIPGLLLLIVNLSWAIWLLGTATTRYRDVGPIVSSLSIVAFYLTPVMWYPSLIGDNSVAHFLLGLNPFYHWLQLVRLPLLGTWPTAENWGVAVLSACLGWLATIAVIRRYRSKIAFWV